MEVELQDHFITYETKSFNADYNSFSYKRNDNKVISDIDSEIKRAEKERIRAENAEKELALLKEKLSLLNND